MNILADGIRTQLNAIAKTTCFLENPQRKISRWNQNDHRRSCTDTAKAFGRIVMIT